MESVAEGPPTVAPASTEMPGFADGTTSMRELPRQLAESIANEIVDAEAGQLCEETGTSRNGCRDGKPIACAGTLDLRIPKTRRGSFFPDDVLARCQRADGAPVSATAETGATGTGARKVRRMAREPGAERLPEGQAGAMAQSLDESPGNLGTRPLGDSQMPRVWPDAACVKRRGEGRAAPTAIVTAMGRGSAGRRRVPGISVVFDSVLFAGWGWYRKSVPNDEAWRIACTPLNRGPGRSSSTAGTASRRRRPYGSSDIPAAHSW